MVVTLTGNNILTLRQRLEELTDGFTSKYGELALERIDGAETSAEAVLDSVQSLPFLAEKKMVILGRPAENKQLTDKIEQIISSTGETTDLIIYDPEPDKRTAYYKSLQKLTNMEQFSELDVPGLVRWLVEQASKSGGELTTADAHYLVERLGVNQQLLASELQKLLLYEKKISRFSIDLLTEPTPQGKIFDLLDAAFGKNVPKALKLYENQRTQKIEPQAIMAMLIWQLHLITLTKLAEGRSMTEVAADSGIKAYPLNKAASLASKLDYKKLKTLIAELLEIDVKAKTTTYDLDEALKNYIVTL